MRSIISRELALRDARSQQQSWIFGLVLLVLLATAAFVFYTYRQRQERRRTELELANLRAQINPHFIFNCLNSIYRYTKERDTDTAAKYLQKFSSLLRLVLENSRSEKITLAYLPADLLRPALPGVVAQTGQVVLTARGIGKIHDVLRESLGVKMEAA